MTHRYVASPAFDQLPPPLQEATAWAPVDSTLRVDPKLGSSSLSPYDVRQLVADAKLRVRPEHFPDDRSAAVLMVPGERGSAEVRHETDAYLLRVRIDRALLVTFKSSVEPWNGASALLSRFLAEGTLVDRAGVLIQPQESRELTGGGTLLRYRTPPPFVGLASEFLVYGTPKLLACALPLLIDYRPNPLA